MVGVIALMLSKHKKQERDTGKNDCKTVEEIREHLLKYTMDKGRLGKDNSWGYGVIDVQKLFGMSSASSASSSKSSSSISSSLSSASSESSDSSKSSSNKATPIFHDGQANPALLAWGVFSLFIVVALTFFIVSKCSEDDVDIPEPPNSYWDEKFQRETQ